MLEGIAKDLPDFSWIKEDLLKDFEYIGKLPERDREGVAGTKLTKIRMKLNKDDNKFIIKPLTDRNATYSEKTKKITISPEIFDDIKDALVSGDKEDLNKKISRLTQALNHEYTQKTRSEKGKDFDFNTKGLNQISLNNVSGERLKGLITLYNDQNYLSDTQEVGAFAVQIASVIKDSGKSINDYLDDVLKGTGKGNCF